MARIIQRKPYTATTRFQSHINYREVLTTDKPYKKLLESQIQNAGRNSNGRICVRHHGGGNKTKYRVMDWKRDRKGVEGTIVSVEYDPNRTAFISLVQYIDGDRRYVLATEGAGVGTKVISSPEADIKPGNALPLKKIPPGSFVHSIEMKPGAGAQMVRSAGAAATLIGRIEGYVQVRLPSGEVRIVHEDCYATLGTVSNSDHMNVSIGKAGRNRWKGWRPRVRGVAMNPVDHPMGGGEGRTSGGRHPCSPRGQLAKGLKTRKKNHRTDKFIVSRRKKKK